MMARVGSAILLSAVVAVSCSSSTGKDGGSGPIGAADAASDAPIDGEADVDGEAPIFGQDAAIVYGRDCTLDGKVHCFSNAVCIFPSYGACGTDGTLGRCYPSASVPSCSQPTSGTVCGCDGKTYDSECLANSAGISVRSKGPCG